ncbi:sensor domain-containing diguanylate cyclase [Undibacterium sp.]|uniref:sensor domain-containing diguanylate cyclase n=1 Tax=Undibacterium sp. TaxID=1914977 RepID=UPI0025F55DA6|nr:sensor domain-containing diguanylate cyclase [Undibacterium sp.]
MNASGTPVNHRHAIESSLDGYLHVSHTGHLIDVNAAYCRLSGYSRDELLGMHISALAENAELTRQHTELIISLGSYRFETSHRRKDGSYWSADVSATYSEMNDGEMFGFLRDISERKRLESLIAQTERHFALLVAATPVGVFETNASGACIFVNHQWSEMTGLSQEEARGNGWVAALHPEDRELVASAWAAAVTEGLPFRQEYRFIDKQGKLTWVLGQSQKLHSSEGKTLGYIGSTTDISESKLLAAQIHEMAFLDALTQLPNRRYLHDRLRLAIALSKRKKSYGALMFMDLDNFKPVNDEWGHEAGDQLLVEAARRIKACLREVDTVARFGGDEFVVIVSELDNNLQHATAQAKAVAEKIRQSLSLPFHLRSSLEGQAASDSQHLGSASIGVVMFINEGDTQNDILKWADHAMYQAKKAGGNTIVFHT